MEPGRSPDGALPNGEHKGVTTVRCAGRTLRQNQVIGSGQLNVPCLIDRRTRACGPKRGGARILLCPGMTLNSTLLQFGKGVLLYADHLL